MTETVYTLFFFHSTILTSDRVEVLIYFTCKSSLGTVLYPFFGDGVPTFCPRKCQWTTGQAVSQSVTVNGGN